MTGDAALTSGWANSWAPRAPLISKPVAARETCDLVVVGGGILGLSAALHAARAGQSVRVLEAGEIGAAASGVNGGQVIAGLKYDPDWIMEHFGEERGGALVKFSAGIADAVFDLIAREGLDVPHTRTGWIQASHTARAAEAASRRARQWMARGVAAKIYTAEEVAAATGARGYVGGWLDPRGGTIHPLAFTRELARVAAGSGVRIATHTRATKLSQRSGGWRVETEGGGQLDAKRVIVATNAYADTLVPRLAPSLIPLHSFQIGTARLPAEVQARILPGGQAVSDSRRVVIYYRKTPDGRLFLGGRGSMAEPTSAQGWAHLERAMLRLFPDLAGIAIERRWFGRVCMTLDHLPHIHEPEPGLVIAAGCQGRGVGLMTALGPRIAEYVLMRDSAALPFPLTAIRPIPLHRFRRIGVGAAIAWYRLIDAFGY